MSAIFSVILNFILVTTTATTDLPFDFVDYLRGTVVRTEYVTSYVDIYSSNGSNVINRLEYVTIKDKSYNLPAHGAILERLPIEDNWKQQVTPDFGMIVDLGVVADMKEDSYWRKITSMNYAKKNTSKFYKSVKSMFKSE